MNPNEPMFKTPERCCVCDDETERAGQGDDSLYGLDGCGPYCPMCYGLHVCDGCGEDFDKPADSCEECLENE